MTALLEVRMNGWRTLDTWPDLVEHIAGGAKARDLRWPRIFIAA